MDKETIKNIEITRLVPFKNHPYQVKDDEQMKQMIVSIKENGVLSPIVVRPVENGNFEIISGHRRMRASELAELQTIPAIVREVDDTTTTILMVDSNLQREDLLFSEKAYAYKMKMDAIKSQGTRTDLTSSQLGTKFRSDVILSSASGDSRNQIQRYIRLTNLIKPILDMVDKKTIAFSPAVEISYLKADEQSTLYDTIQSEDCTPSLSQAVRIKKLSQQAELTPEMIYKIMIEEKANQKEQVRIMTDKLKKYFPSNYTAEQMEQSILKLLEEHHLKKQKIKESER